MNLVLLIGRFPPGVVGGAELQAEAWARRLARRHALLVVTRKGAPGEPDREERDGFAVVRLPVSRVPLLRTALDVRLIERAVEAVTPRPDALLCFQTFISGFVGVRLQRRLGVPAVVWVRGEDEYRVSRGRTRHLSVGVWREAAGVLVQSEGNRAAVLGAVRRFAPRAVADVAARLEVVPNGIELPPAPPPRGARTLAVGRLIHDKGMDVAIDAVAGVQGLLTIAGDGPERAALEARARAHGLDVRFEGFVDRARLAALYREASSVVLASRRGEGLPNVLLEAMAWARPVVATAVTGVADLVRDGENGLLVPPGDVGALRAALARLAHERGLADRLAAGARRTAEAHDWARVEPRLEALLERWRRR
uniref:Glycosyltransferase n=1 Tax=Eiseniibacteriota bacterium TaxID=2212470 RepID=A0A832MMW9_UNCEI